MFENFLNYILKKEVKIPLKILLITGSCILCSCYVHNSFTNVNVKWIGILAIFLIGILLIIDIGLKNTLPKAKKNNTSILIRIYAKDKEEYDDTKMKFGNEFKTILEKNNIEVIYIPFHLIEKNMSNIKKDIIKLLGKTRCIFLATIDVKSEEITKEIKYLTKINMGIMHPPYRKDIEECFQKELDTLTRSTSRLEYTNKEKLLILEVTAQHISCVCQYLLARATYFNGELRLSNNISSNLYTSLKGTMLKDDLLKKMTTILCYNTHMLIARLESNKIKEDLNITERELNLANSYIPNTYEYHLNISACIFKKSRNIIEVKKHLNYCIQFKDREDWKYSDAFLCAYQSQTEGSILSKYFKAFKVPYSHFNLITYIEEILEDEPDKNMLRFAIFLLYLELRDYKCANNVLKEYLANKPSKELEDSTKHRILNKYKTKEIHNIINKIDA